MVVTVVTAHGSGGSGGWGGSGEYGNSPIGKNGGSPTLERADHFAKGGSGEAKGRGVASEPKMADVGDLDTFGMVWGELLSVQQTDRSLPRPELAGEQWCGNVGGGGAAWTYGGRSILATEEP